MWNRYSLWKNFQSAPDNCWIILYFPQVIGFSIKHSLVHQYYGRALKLMMKQQEEKCTKDEATKMIEVGIGDSSTAKIEPPHDKTNKMACVPSEDSDQPGHPPSVIRVFAVCMKKAWVLSYPLRLWSDLADAQADLSLHWAHSHFVGFVMRRLILWVLKWYTIQKCNQGLGILVFCQSFASLHNQANVYQ